MDALVLENLTVTSSDRPLLSIPFASFQRGTVYGIVGPSGAGKSTLLRVVNFLQRPDSGTFSLYNKKVDLTTLSHAMGLTLQRQMAYVAQKPVMFQTTVFKNVALGLHYRGIPREIQKEKVKKTLELVGLEALADRRATSLSGGEAQRIALARALVLEPQILLLDEPTSNLDPTNVSLIEQVLLRIRSESPVTILMVTHHLQQARRCTDQCIFLYDGQIVEQNDTDAFFRSPQTETLRDFISGKMVY